jgi:hypothetical protein
MRSDNVCSFHTVNDLKKFALFQTITLLFRRKIHITGGH